MKRFQSRRGGGQFTRNTMENTFGLHVDVCESCRSFVPYSINEAPPNACPRCSAVIVREKCAVGRCTERFPNRRYYPECGKPAVACDVVTRWGQCEKHVTVHASETT